VFFAQQQGKMKTKYSVGLALFVSISAPAQILTNGSFEIPAIPPNTERGFNPPEVLPGWNVGGAYYGNVMINGVGSLGYGIGGADGSQYMIFGSGAWPSGGNISQTFPTKAGHHYTVSFRVGRLGDPGAKGPVQATAIVTSGLGAVLEVLSVTVTNTGWLPASTLQFAATDSTSTLTLQDTMADPDGNTALAVDAVSVELEQPFLTSRVSAMEICWKSFANTGYQVQARYDLSPNGSWQNFGEVIQGNGTTNCTSVPVTGTNGVYRVIEFP
jgi:hypothetical protein